jgi:CheY-like chemotaxis protein
MNPMHTILIVDDEFGLAETVGDVLATMDYAVSIAVNGKLALASLRQTRPDVILLDLMMPVMTGAEMLAALKGDANFADYADIPVILMSAAIQQASLRELRPFIVDFLQKPFTLEQLMSALSKALGA